MPRGPDDLAVPSAGRRRSRRRRLRDRWRTGWASMPSVMRDAHEAGADDHHAPAGAEEVVAEALGEGVDAGLGGAVDEVGRRGPGRRRPTTGTTRVPWPCRRIGAARGQPGGDRADVVGVDGVAGGERGRRRRPAWSPRTPNATRTRSRSPTSARTPRRSRPAWRVVVAGRRRRRARPRAPAAAQVLGDRADGVEVADRQHDGAAALLDQAADGGDGDLGGAPRARGPTGRRRERHAWLSERSGTRAVSSAPTIGRPHPIP